MKSSMPSPNLFDLWGEIEPCDDDENYPNHTASIPLGAV